MKNTIKLYLELYTVFLKIGAFTLGGGYAMLPIIQNQVVDKKRWASESEMADYMALAQSLPGVIGINTATAVGYRVSGILGGIVSTLGMITPSVIVIILVAAFFGNMQDNAMVMSAFTGVRAGVLALISIACVRIAKESVQGAFKFAIFVLAAVTILIGVPTQFIILISGVSAIIYYGVIIHRIKKKDDSVMKQ